MRNALTVVVVVLVLILRESREDHEIQVLVRSDSSFHDTRIIATV